MTRKTLLECTLRDKRWPDEPQHYLSSFNVSTWITDDQYPDLFPISNISHLGKVSLVSGVMRAQRPDKDAPLTWWMSLSRCNNWGCQANIRSRCHPLSPPPYPRCGLWWWLQINMTLNTALDRCAGGRKETVVQVCLLKAPSSSSWDIFHIHETETHPETVRNSIPTIDKQLI